MKASCFVDEMNISEVISHVNNKSEVFSKKDGK